MCGIIGYAGTKAAAPILLDGLSKLEYRGYDSTGLAVLGPDGSPSIRKAEGKLSTLIQSLDNNLPDGTIGIGHTRWATHGSPTNSNAHPHSDCDDSLVVVHNGIVENFLDLRKELESQGHIFSSQTDSECIPHLIEFYLKQDMPLADAVRATAGRIKGAHAVVVASRQEPNRLIAFRLGNAGGIVVGHGNKEIFIASDLPALLPYTKKVTHLSGGEMVSVTCSNVEFCRLDDSSHIDKNPAQIPFDSFSAVKGEYKHFMLKEICDQPTAILDTLRGRVSFETGTLNLDDIPLTDKEILAIDRVVLVGMGTSLHAAMVGRALIESFAQIPAEVDNSSEFRYRNPVVNARTLVVSVCQSGETADTLAAMELANSKGARQITLCNYEGTQTTQLADDTLLIRAGVEISVAGTKTFTCSLTSLLLLALKLGIKRRTLKSGLETALVSELSRFPDLLGQLVESNKLHSLLAQKYYKYSNFLYLGRGMHHPLAMEGALKLKEISYIHAEGYPAGEMKHGPISLVDENVPVVALIPNNHLYPKMLSNIIEVKARGGTVIALATESDTLISNSADDVVYIPKSSEFLAPILMAVPLQLFAYNVAVHRGCDVDQPRNLAKSVTVE